MAAEKAIEEIDKIDNTAFPYNWDVNVLAVNWFYRKLDERDRQGLIGKL